MTPTTHAADSHARQVLTAGEVAAVCGLAPRTIYDRVKKYGHVLGVRPVPDTGRRVLFSRVLIEQAINGGTAAERGHP